MMSRDPASITMAAVMAEGADPTPLAWPVRLVVAFALAGTLLPLLPVGAWYVRLFDFPRLQLAALALLAIPVAAGDAWIGGVRLEHALILVLVAATVAWQLAHVVRYTRLWPREMDDVSPQSPGPPTRLVVANVSFENGRRAAALNMFRGLRPDILLLIEIDEEWASALRPLRQEFPHRVEAIRGDGLGIALWSRLPLHRGHVRHLVSDRRASIHARLHINGHAVNFVGLHPTPPGLDDETGQERRDSRVRDAELVLVAREVGHRASESWIVAGDFNDVAWSHTTRLFKRLSGLVDPRVGRGLYNTYHAEYPLLRYPIDQLFVTRGFRLASLSRARTPGSDHFAIVTDLVLEQPEGALPRPEGDDRREAGDLVREGEADASARGHGVGDGLTAAISG